MASRRNYHAAWHLPTANANPILCGLCQREAALFSKFITGIQTDNMCVSAVCNPAPMRRCTLVNAGVGTCATCASVTKTCQHACRTMVTVSWKFREIVSQRPPRTGTNDLHGSPHPILLLVEDHSHDTPQCSGVFGACLAVARAEWARDPVLS